MTSGGPIPGPTCCAELAAGVLDPPFGLSLGDGMCLQLLLKEFDYDPKKILHHFRQAGGAQPSARPSFCSTPLSL